MTSSMVRTVITNAKENGVSKYDPWHAEEADTIHRPQAARWLVGTQYLGPIRVDREWQQHFLYYA